MSESTGSTEVKTYKANIQYSVLKPGLFGTLDNTLTRIFLLPYGCLKLEKW